MNFLYLCYINNKFCLSSVLPGALNEQTNSNMDDEEDEDVPG